MLSASAAEVQDTYTEASDVLGFDLWKLVEHGPEQELGRTQNTQPALLAASIALHRLWQRAVDMQPQMVAGHSLGEYSALVATGALGFADAIELVHARGCLMQSAVPEGEGGMVAVLGLDNEQLEQICQQVEGTVVQANINAPGQVVLAGEKKALQTAMVLCKDAGAKRCLELPVSVPSHSPLMQPALAALGERIDAIAWQQPTCPVVQNSSASPEQDPQVIRENLKQQLCNPVRWIESVRTMADAGIRNMVEVGPGKVLSGLCRRIDGDLECLALNQADQVGQVWEQIRGNTNDG